MKWGSSLAAFAFAALTVVPAAASDTAEVQININVEEIAVLQVLSGIANVIVADSNRAGYPAPEASLAKVRLFTNYCIGGLQIDFPRVAGLRGGFPSHYYGRATGVGNGNTLGANPYAYVTGPSGTQVAHGGVASTLNNTFFNPTTPLPGGLNQPLIMPGPSNNLCPEPDGEGIFDLFLGAVTKWDLTLSPEPLFAAPDTYVIPLTVSIIP